MKKIQAIVLGASSGGLSALTFVLERIPKDFTIPIFIAQHLHAESEGFWINLIDQKSNIVVKEAENKENIQIGHAYIAPPDYHMIVDYDYTIALSKDEKVNYSRPSIDVLFESASDVYEKNLIGIVLTGTNHDGAHGLTKIKEKGGITIAQDPSEAEYKEMPEAAIMKGKVDFILSLHQIVEFLKKNQY